MKKLLLAFTLIVSTFASYVQAEELTFTAEPSGKPWELLGV